jgi:Ca-activated chloride channel family protein
MNSFRFEDPWAMALALVLVPLVALSLRRGRTASLQYPPLGFLRGITGPATRLRHAPLAIRCAVLLLIILALARPQLGNRKTEILSEGVDIALAIDTSGTMKALDFEVDGKRATRLTAVKEVVKDFIEGRGADRVGMVVFGTHAFLQCPLTLDHDVLLEFLDKADVGMAGEFTAIGSAIALSASRLKDTPGKDKVIILLTDGINNRGQISPELAADIAKKLGIKVYTIGVGSKKEKAPFYVQTILGGSLRYENVPLDEGTLKKIAEKTGARYFRATDTEGLEKIYSEIDEMEKTEVKMKEYTDYFELYPWLVFPALALAAFEFTLRNTWLRMIP